MRRLIFILLSVLFLAGGCKKNNGISDSGTVTISNELSGTGPYYAYGLSIVTGQKVSTLSSPKDVITILEDHDINLNVRKLFFACENFENSFYRYGDYNDATAAKTAFDNLKSFTVNTWEATGDTVRANQIWLFRTSDEKYAKIRVVSTLTEKRDNMVFPYAECTIEWVYQPDGTLLFP